MNAASKTRREHDRKLKGERRRQQRKDRAAARRDSALPPATVYLTSEGANL